MEIRNINKILIIQLRRIGDVLLTTPVIESLRERFPESQIDFLVERSAYDVLTGNPYLNNIILSNKSFFEQIKLIKRIRKERYSLILDFLGNPRSAWITFFSAARYRVGFDFPGRKFAYNICVKRDTEPKYLVDFKLDALRTIGITSPRKKTFFHIPDDAKVFRNDSLGKYLIEDKILIGMAPNSRRKARIWLKEYFTQLADRLIDKYNSQVILFWGPGEKESVEEIASLMKNNPIISPPTDLKQLAALIDRCDVMITNDNGPKHIAVSVGTPTLTIYGPTNSKTWNPPDEAFHVAVESDVDCLGCNKQECETMECMKNVTPDMVENVVVELLKIKGKV